MYIIIIIFCLKLKKLLGLDVHCSGGRNAVLLNTTTGSITLTIRTSALHALHVFFKQFFI